MADKFIHGYALLIGVRESAYSKLSLPVTVKDTQAIYAALVDPELCAYPDNKEYIRVLNNTEAIRQGILDSLNCCGDRVKQVLTVILKGWLRQRESFCCPVCGSSRQLERSPA